MKPNQISIAKLLLAAIIFISVGTVFGVTAYVLSFKKTLPVAVHPQVSSTPAPTPPPAVKDEISDWKTYRNEEYGFELKYPSELTFVSNGPNVSQQAIDRGEIISGTVQPSFDTITFSDKKNTGNNFYIEIFPTVEKKISEKGYVDDYFYLFGPCDLRWGFEPAVKKMEKFNDVDVLKVDGKNSKDARKTDFTSCTYLKNEKKNLMVLGIDNINNEEDFDRANEILQKILSTLKLFKKDAEGRFLITVAENGYEFEYPGSYFSEPPKVTVTDSNVSDFFGGCPGIPLEGAQDSEGNPFMYKGGKVTIDGIVYCRYDKTIYSEGACTNADIDYATVKDKKLYTINFLGGACCADIEAKEQINKQCVKANGDIPVTVEKVISTFKFTNQESSFSCGTSTVNDIDGNTYNTVQMDTQCWTKENLKVTKDPQGKPITRYCYDNDPKICDTEGGLYTWDTAMNNSSIDGAQGICPSGWHVPKDSEWYRLESLWSNYSCSPSRSGANNAWDCEPSGTELKQGGSSGFEGIFAGNRGIDGSFSGRGTDTVFWSSTENGSIPWLRVLNITRSSVHRTTALKSYGHSIRCLKD